MLHCGVPLLRDRQGAHGRYEREDGVPRRRAPVRRLGRHDALPDAQALRGHQQPGDRLRQHLCQRRDRRGGQRADGRARQLRPPRPRRAERVATALGHRAHHRNVLLGVLMRVPAAASHRHRARGGYAQGPPPAAVLPLRLGRLPDRRLRLVGVATLG